MNLNRIPVHLVLRRRLGHRGKMLLIIVVNLFKAGILHGPSEFVIRVGFILHVLYFFYAGPFELTSLTMRLFFWWSK